MQPVGRFLAARWRGEVPLPRLFWRDMLLVGSAVNGVTTIGALVVLAAKLPVWLAWAVFASPIPYNLFLVFAVWRLAERLPGAGAYQAGAILWLVLALLL